MHKIVELTGYEGDVVWDTSKPDGQPRRKLDIGRARTEFGFEAEVGFDEGLRRTIAAYLASQGVAYEAAVLESNASLVQAAG